MVSTALLTGLLAGPLSPQAAARPVAVILGSGAAPDRQLQYADDDAWRAAWLLSAAVDEADLRVLTEPDESTRGRAFPGGAPGAPSAEALIQALGELVDGDEPREVVVFLAAHGDPDAIFLADGRHDFLALRERLRAELGPDDRLLLIGDACLSARWRSGGDLLGIAPDPRVAFPPVDRGVGGAFELLVDSVTPEDPSLEGGVFSYLALSGLVGGADLNGDGAVEAQELSDFVHAYAAGSHAPFIPVVRAPDGSPSAEIFLDWRGAELILEADEPARWVVALGGGPILVEAFTRPGERRSLHLPPGDYEVVQIPCARAPGSGVYRPGGEPGWSYAVSLAAGDEAPLGAERPREPLSFAWVRGESAPGSSIWAVSLTGPLVGPLAPPTDAARYHGGRAVVGAGPSLRVGAFEGSGRQPGLAVRWTPWRPGQTSRAWLEVEAGREGAMDPARTEQVSALAGWERDLQHGRLWSTSLAAGLGGHGLRLTAEPGGDALSWGTLGPVARLELAGTAWLGDDLSIRAGLGWEPAAILVEHDVAGGAALVLQPDLDRWRAGAALQWSF